MRMFGRNGLTSDIVVVEDDLVAVPGEDRLQVWLDIEIYSGELWQSSATAGNLCKYWQSPKNSDNVLEQTPEV